MNWLDWVLVAVIGASTCYGARRGLVLEVFGLVAVLLGVGVGIVFHERLADPLAQWVEPRGAARLVAFVLVSVAVGLVVAALGRVARKAVRLALLGWVDTLAGCGIGFLKGAFAAWALLTLGVAYVPRVADASEDSRLAPVVLSASEDVGDALPEGLREVLKDRMEDLREVWEGAARK